MATVTWTSFPLQPTTTRSRGTRTTAVRLPPSPATSSPPPPISLHRSTQRMWTATAIWTYSLLPTSTARLPGTRTTAVRLPPSPATSSPPPPTAPGRSTRRMWMVTAIQMSSPPQPTTTRSPGTRTTAVRLPPSPVMLSPPTPTVPGRSTLRTWTVTATWTSFLPLSTTTRSRGTRTTAVRPPLLLPISSPPTPTTPHRSTRRMWTTTAIWTSSPPPGMTIRLPGTRTTALRPLPSLTTSSPPTP